MQKLTELISQICNLWFKINEKIRFLIVGGFNSLVSFLFFVLLMHFFAQYFIHDTTQIYNYVKENCAILKYITFIQFIRQVSLLLAWVLSSFISFTMQRFFVFRAHGAIIRQYLKCLSTWMIGYLVNAVVLEILASFFDKINLFPPIIETDISQFFALGLSAIATFILFKYFAFKKHKAV